MGHDNIEQSLLKEWLDKLQQESWQLELLISGFAIFGLFEVKAYLNENMLRLFANLHQNITLQTRYVVAVSFAIFTYIFITNLVVHIIVRGLWIGAIGLRYVSGDIDYDQLNYSDRFIDYYKRTVGRFDDYIVGLEKFASIVFSYTFLILFVFFSFFLFYIELMLVYKFTFRFGEFIGVGGGKLGKIITTIIAGLGILVTFDFVTLGLIKRIKQRHISKVYFVIYKIVGFVTLSFLWRPLLLNFLDHKYTRRLLIFLVPYIFILIFIIPESGMVEYEYFPAMMTGKVERYKRLTAKIINKHSFNHYYYDDQVQGKDRMDDFYAIRYFSIPSIKVTGNLMEVFVKYDSRIGINIAKDDSIEKLAEIGYTNQNFSGDDYSVLSKKEKKQFVTDYLDSLENRRMALDDVRKKTIRDSLYLEMRKQDKTAYEQNLLAIKKRIKSSFGFSIDEKAVSQDSVTCDFYIHPNAGEKGMLCFFPIQLKLGRHYLEYRKIYQYENSDRIDTMFFKIPFIYMGK